MIGGIFQQRGLTDMIKTIRKYLIENIVYVVVFSFAGIYLVIDKGISHTINYASILLALFIPLFVVINLYSLIKSLLLKEKIEYKELLVCVALITLTLIVYIFGLNNKQRLFLGVYNGIISVLIVIVMLFKTIRNKL